MEIIDASLEHIPNIVTLNLREYGIPENEALEHFTELQWWGNQELLKWHFSNLQKNGGGILLAIDETGNILGELDYVKSIQEGRYHIIWILVDKEARRKGIAKSLIYELQKRGKREGIGKIWTEAEDERTEELYQSLGGIVDHLENFWIDLNFDLDEDPNDHELLFEDGELVDVIPRKISIRGKEIRWNNNTGEVFAGYKRIIGDYLTPEFDLSQLTTSVGTMAQDFVWGDTTPMEMVEYTLENGKILAILTQYVRVYQKGEVNNEEIMGIIKDVVHRLACKNYEAVDVQVLRSRKLGKTLLATGFAKVEEDPVFQINCHKID